MTIQTMHFVTCDGTKNKYCHILASDNDTKRLALFNAKNEGFRRVKVKDGSYRDFCEYCYDKFKRGEV